MVSFEMLKKCSMSSWYRRGESATAPSRSTIVVLGQTPLRGVGAINRAWTAKKNGYSSQVFKPGMNGRWL